jgi:hypothetical protein
MGSGPTTTLEAKGYGANYITDFNIRTYNASGTGFDVFFGTAQGDVGIGNTSPAAKLDVTGTGNISSTFTVGANMGMNVTPSAWATVGPVIEFTGGGFVGSQGTVNTFYVGSNNFYNGTNFKYKQDGFATNFQVGAGTGGFTWSTSPSGTAGNNITFTTAMILTNSGNVGIGTSSPSAKLHISGTAANTVCFLQDTTGYSLFQSGNTSGGIYLGVDSSTASGFANGAYSRHIYSTGAYPLIISTNDTERMRITSGGNVGIGTTAASAGRLVVTSANNTSGIYAAIFADSSGADLLLVRGDGAIFTGTRTNSPYNLSTTGRSAVIESSGALGYLVSTRESKANIESIKSIDFINKLNPVQFNYRKKDNINNVFTDEIYKNITYGFIADEVEKVNKELVFYKEDGSLAGVEYNNMIAILTKAIQELKAEIEILKNK